MSALREPDPHTIYAHFAASLRTAEQVAEHLQHIDANTVLPDIARLELMENRLWKQHAFVERHKDVVLELSRRRRIVTARIWFLVAKQSYANGIFTGKGERVLHDPCYRRLVQAINDTTDTNEHACIQRATTALIAKILDQAGHAISE